MAEDVSAPKPHPLRNKTVRMVLFVIRCTLAALIAYWIPIKLGLQYPVWASMLAVNIARDPLSKTQEQTMGQIGGTLFGSIVSILVALASQHFPLSVATQMAIAVSICALATARFQILYVSLWACLIVLLSAAPGVTSVEVGLYRAGEVMLGSLVGAAVHYAMRSVLAVIVDEREEDFEDRLY